MIDLAKIASDPKACASAVTVLNWSMVVAAITFMVLMGYLSLIIF
ncbi:hypothetical protein [Massilia varians]|nr:hypothetical protein [Massilia varians]MDK6078356.1 hypothetical protein [Massilia varians]